MSDISHGENIVLHIRYTEPIIVNGWRAETDTITFDDEEQLEQYIDGNRAFDYLDNAIRKKDNEILLYAEYSNGKREYYNEKEELKFMDFKEKVINAMKEAGYEFDDIDSSDNRLVFRGDYGSQMDFPSYEEAGEWLDGVVFDDPDVSDRVEQVMHPERFNDFQIETDDLRVFYSYQTKEIYEDLMSDPNRKIAFGTEINGGFNGDCYFTYTDTTKMRNDWREIANITERQGNEREAFLAYALSDRGGIVEVAVESTSDYTNADFNNGFRLVTVDENEGRVVPYGEKVFNTRNEAIKEIIDSPNLVERSYDDVIHKAGDLMTKYSLYGKPAFFKIYPREDGWDNVLNDWRSESKRDYKVYEEADKWVLYRDFNDLPMDMREPARQLQNALDKAGEVKYYDHRFDFHHTADELFEQVKNNYIDNVDALAKISEILRSENRNDDADLVNLYIDEINEAKEHDDYNVARMKIDFIGSREYGRSTGGGLDDFTLNEDADGRSSLTVFYEPSNDTVLISVNELSADSEGTGATSIPLNEFLKYSRDDFDRTVGEIISYGMERTETEKEEDRILEDNEVKEFVTNERNKDMENSHGENEVVVGGNEQDKKTVSQKVGRDSLSPQTKDRQDKVNELRNKIKDGVEAVRNEDGYKAWLKTRSHNFINKYSFNNIMLVAFQKPDASTVMGYEQWKEYGRQVKAGIKGVNILVPMMYSEKSEGNLCRDICAKLSSEIQKGNNPASYRLPNTDLTFSATKGSPQIRMSLRGKEWVLQNRSELNAFLQKNVIGKTPRYYNPQSVFDVTDTYTPSVLAMKRGFSENEVIKGKGENVPITNDEGKVLAKAVWSKDANAPKGYDFVEQSEIGKGTWELVSAPDGEPVKTSSKSKDEYLVLNSDERKNRFKDTLEMRVVAKDEKNLSLLFNALKAVSEDKGVPVKIVSKESEEWGTSKEANGYYHKPQGVELAQFPKGYIVIPTELMNENMAHAVKTLFHECTHADLHNNVQKLESEMGQPVSRAMKETQAESVAFMACEAYGIDSSDYSFKYLATWANDAELKDFTDSLKVIDREAKQLVDEVNAKLDEMGYSRDFKELPKDPLSNDAVNQKASEIVGSINELNAKVEMMKNQIEALDNEVKTTQNADKAEIVADKAEIVTAMKNNIVKITDEISNQIKLVGELENAQTRVEQNNVLDKLTASNNRVDDLMMAHGSLEDSLKTISVRNKEGLHEQFLGNSLSTLNKMSKEYDELKNLSSVQKQYIAKSPYVKEALAPLLNVNPKEFVAKVAERAENAMNIASKTGMFVEVVSCKASTEPAVFLGGELAHPKVANKIVGEAEKQIRSMKAQRDFQPNTNASIAVYSLTKNKNISCYVANLKIGDGTQLSLSDYLHKVAPQKKDLLEDFDKATKERGAKDKLISSHTEFSHGEKSEQDDKTVTMETAMEQIKSEREKIESETPRHENNQQEADKGKNKKERGKE